MNLYFDDLPEFDSAHGLLQAETAIALFENSKMVGGKFKKPAQKTLQTRLNNLMLKIEKLEGKPAKAQELAKLKEQEAQLLLLIH